MKIQMQQSGGLLLESASTYSTPYVLPSAERQQIWPVFHKPKSLKEGIGMKRNHFLFYIIVLCVTVVLLWSLWTTVFWSGSYSFLHGTDGADCICIEIIEVDGSIVSTDFTDTSYDESYNEEKITVLAVIPEIQQLICELDAVTSYQPLGTPIGEIGGVMIRFTFSDGDAELVSAYGSALISGREVHVATKTFDEEEFNRFLSRWLEDTQESN